ncbi:MAG: thioredoxin [Alphaproteobacteria bacterium]|jgi:thioredoxin 1|nr:thioredoxin [Alphaproteobacteria bacterium]MBT5827851.1 thioredoxin [Alphaproteobacteria bacterium]
MVKSTNDQDFAQDVLKSENLVLVDFWAEWCGPCKQLAPVLEQLATEYEGKVKILKLNIEDSPETPTTYQVRGIPNLLLFKDGEIVDSKVGALPKKTLADWLDSNLA